MGKKINLDKNKLLQLWDTGYHECKILTILALKPKDCQKKEIDKLMKEIVSWDMKQSNAAVIRWIAADALKELVLSSRQNTLNLC